MQCTSTVLHRSLSLLHELQRFKFISLSELISQCDTYFSHFFTVILYCMLVLLEMLA